MSGLESLAALGLACNVFRVISCGRETIGIFKEIYHNGSPDGALVENAKVLADLAAYIRTSKLPANLKKHERQLHDSSKICQAIARDLQEEIAFIIGYKRKGSFADAIKIAAKANWRKRRLENMERKLKDIEQVMQSGLLARIWCSISAKNRIYTKLAWCVATGSMS
ncbi:hypothetical protein ACHAQH_009028 [Verticillium albo-atrum]